MTMTVAPPTRSVVADCIRSATAAPSLHNSQPWLFRLGSSTVDVYADPERWLPVLDPDSREQMVGVGAAVLNLRLALRQAGYRCDVTLFPVPHEPDLAARVVVMHPAVVTPAVEALALAIPQRRTNRSPFAQAPVPADVLEHLRDAARKEGAVLATASAPARDAILGLARSADRWLRARPGYRDELARWTSGRLRRDGVPSWAVGPSDALEAVPMRDFTELSSMPRPSATFEPDPTILLLATKGDRPADWVRAGQALQRVLLAATCKGVSAMPISQPVEMPAVRRLLIHPRAGLSVQMVLRIGYGKPAGRTPRRTLSDVLLPGPYASR